MRKLTITFIFLFFFLVSAYSQAPLGQGNKQINAGFGLTSEGLPVYVGMDFGVHPDITLGPVISARAWPRFYDNEFGDRVFGTYFGFFGGFNVNYHFNRLFELPSEWDFYAGGTVGFYAYSYPNDYVGDNISSLGLTAQVGGRYFISDDFALNLELGGGYLEAGRFGITYILN